MPVSCPAPPSRLAWLLGIGGLLPFVAGAGALWLLDQAGLQAWAGLLLVSYSALIASFLGGIHWGLAIRGSQAMGARLAWGIVPSLLVWPALLLPVGPGLVLVAGVLAACYAVDHAVYGAEGLQDWLGLRGLLTAVAVASCTMGAWAAW